MTEDSARYNELVAAGKSFLAARKTAEKQGRNGVWAEIKAHSLWNLTSHLNKLTSFFRVSHPIADQSGIVQSSPNDESQRRAQEVSKQITSYLGTDPISSTEQLARRAAFVEILTKTLAAGAARKAIPDHLALKIQAGTYWNLSPQDQLAGLTSLLADPGLAETLETISKRYPPTSMAPSLPEVSISVNSRMAVNLAGYSNKPNDEKTSSRTSVLSLLGTGQNVLILLGRNETPSDVLSFLGVASNDPRTRLMEFRSTNGEDNHANVLKTYRETDGNIPLADVALNWNNDTSLENTGLAVVTFKDFEQTIQNALQTLIALMRSA